MTADVWILRGGRAFCPAPFGIMGIINLTPDSFYDGGCYTDVAAALRHARQLVADGAHILDLGAESTRPGARSITAEEEQMRLLPVLRILRQDASLLLSVDTLRVPTALKALEAGADILNDVSGCADPAWYDLLGQYRPGYVLMHGGPLGSAQRRPGCREDILEDMEAYFEDRLQRLTAAGLPEDHIVLDPGIGFGKTAEDNVRVVRNMSRFQKFGRPLLMALSMKSLFGHVLGLPTEERALATHIATALTARQGVVLHRVHDARASSHALRLTQLLDDSFPH